MLTLKIKYRSYNLFIIILDAQILKQQYTISNPKISFVVFGPDDQFHRFIKSGLIMTMFQLFLKIYLL